MYLDSTVTLALVPEPVSLSVVSQAHLIEGDRLGQRHPQHVQVRRLVQGQPVSQPGVDKERRNGRMRWFGKRRGKNGGNQQSRDHRAETLETRRRKPRMGWFPVVALAARPRNTVGECLGV